jgi:hypothetical protein
MSERLRIILPSLTAKLQSCVTEADQWVKENQLKNIPDSEKDCLSMLSSAELISMKLENARLKVVAKDDEWAAIIDRMSDEAARKELVIYKEVSEPNLILLQMAEDLNAWLSIHQSRLKERIAKLVTASEAMSNDRHGVNIPKLSLPTFSGKYREWPQFWSLFDASIHSQRRLTDVEKFTYLVSQVEGNARATIAGLQIRGDNYTIAVQLLKDRYERSSASIVAELYAELKQLPVSGTTIPEKRSTLDSCECIFRQLEQAGQKVDTNQSLVVDLLSKFPTDMVRELDQWWSVSIESDLGEIRRQLRRYIDKAEQLNETIERLKLISVASASEAPSSPDFSCQDFGFPAENQSQHGNDQFADENGDCGGGTEPSPTTTFVAIEAFSRRNPLKLGRFCGFCGEQSHFTCHCSMFASLESRIESLRKSGRCTRCMSSRHTSVACRAVIRPCYYCKKYHLSPLCPKRFDSAARYSFRPGIAAETSSCAVPLTNAANPAGRAGDTGSVAGGTSTWFSSSSAQVKVKSTLLLTAKSIVTDAKSGRKIAARIILDSGSQRDYVADRVAKTLGLNGKTENIALKAFGAEKSVELTSTLVRFGIELQDGTVKEIEANTIPFIPEVPMLPPRISREDKEVLATVEESLADDLDAGSQCVDILLGARYFWDLVVGPPQDTSTDIKLVPSKLGLLLSGCVRCGCVDRRPDIALFCLAEKCNVCPGDNVSIRSDLEGYCDLETTERYRGPDHAEMSPVGVEDKAGRDVQKRGFGNLLENLRTGFSWKAATMKKLWSCLLICMSIYVHLACFKGVNC